MDQGVRNDGIAHTRNRPCSRHCSPRPLVAGQYLEDHLCLLRVAGRYLKDHIFFGTGRYLHPSTAPLEVGLMTSIGVLQATEPAGVPPHPPCEGGRGVEHHKRRVHFSITVCLL